jgi:hypothetical protein
MQCVDQFLLQNPSIKKLQGKAQFNSEDGIL